MRYGGTGTKRRLTAEEKLLVHDELALVCVNAGEFTSGACVGFDTHFALTAIHLYPWALHRVVVPADRSRVDYWWHPQEKWLERGVELEVILMPEDTTYRQRNERLVDFTDTLLVGAEYPETDPRSKRSGTWMTKRIADRRGVVVHNPFVFSDLCTLSFSSGNVTPVTEIDDA